MPNLTDTKTLVDIDSVVKLLSALQDALANKRASIRSWESYGKDTFLAFDSYNLGLTTAMEMLGNTSCAIQALAERTEPNA